MDGGGRKLRAIAYKKQRAPKSVGRARSEPVQPLSRRQLFMRRFFHRAEARVETLPPYFMTMISAALIAGSAVYGAVWSGEAKRLVSETTASAGFDVHAVTISGQRFVKERDILDILGLAPGVSLVTFDVARAHETLLREPWIESASVRKVYPGKLSIDLKEREPFAVWQRGQSISVVDRNGLVLDEFNRDLYGALPILVGHGAQRQGAAFLAILDEFPSIKSRVQASLLHSERRWDILLDNRVTVKLPEVGARIALARLAKLDEEKALLSKDLVSIDMRLDDRLVMQLSEEAMVNRRAALERRKEHRSKEKNI